MPVRVVNVEESVALDAAAIAGGIPSRALMRAAAFNAASVICARYPDQLRRGATVLTGAGNNGGDGWAVASALAAGGVKVTVREVVQARTPDAIAERAQASGLIGIAPLSCGVVVDALLGTGGSGELRDAILDAAREIARARDGGSAVVALDVPTGVNGTHGAESDSVVADLTISFGSCKRGTLVSRAACGEIVVVDIGLGALPATLPILIDAAFVHDNVPRIAPDAHKGTRKSVAVIAGRDNMGGAAIMAATGALRSGVGLVQVCTAAGNVASMHTRVPEALVAPLANASSTIQHWADAVLIGPGLGTDEGTRDFIRGVLRDWRGPVVVDAGALSAYADDLDALREVLTGRPAIVTPHPGELSRLTGRDVKYVTDNRFDIGLDVSRKLDATVLLKGTPTVVSSPDGARYVIAAGTAALATGGSGDALGGIVVTLLAQGCAPAIAAACAAWVHGRAAELTPGVRGYRLTDVLDHLPLAWPVDSALPRYPVLASLPGLS
ncbi:MAG TPA: NAD(P)H-hydrate dehydratase [Gemmatimonadaceae bacterium]|nr:NAD(P)H-hydrate dehydratase [Gemmatimonadaceae bacterium]